MFWTDGEGCHWLRVNGRRIQLRRPRLGKYAVPVLLLVFWGFAFAAAYLDLVMNGGK